MVFIGPDHKGPRLFLWAAYVRLRGARPGSDQPDPPVVKCTEQSNPRHPKSSNYLLSRCLEPLRAFSGDVWGFKHLLNRYLDA